MLCLRLDRIVKVEEIQEFFGPRPRPWHPVPAREMPIVPASDMATQMVPTDPAVASRLLLERIRQMRATAVSRFSN